MMEQKIIRLLLKLGYFWVILILTAVSVVASVVITMLMGGYTSGEPPGSGLFIAVTVPVLVAPFTTYVFMRLMVELENARQVANKLALTDELTGIYNRRHFYDLAELEYSRSIRYGIPLSVIIFDIDDFKSVNDRHGHLAGDEVLRDISTECRGVIRRPDVFARYGGEEFVILLPETGVDEAGKLAERLRQTVYEHVCCGDTQRVQITISLGVAQLDAGTDRLDSLIHRADMALYRAKGLGKNRVVVG